MVDALAVLQKAHVKAHTRKLKSGKVVQVRAYENKRTRKANSPAMENQTLRAQPVPDKGIPHQPLQFQTPGEWGALTGIEERN